MKEVYSIFVEGVADKRFIEQLLEHVFHVPALPECVFKTDGCTKLMSPTTEKTYLNQMKRTSADGGVNLVIFDADDNFNQRRSELLAWKERNHVDFELFLFPDNANIGELEDLLGQIINMENQPVMNCWDNYEQALEKIDLPWRNGKPLTLPAKKTRIYAYLEALVGESKSEKEKIKEKNRDYLNRNHWDLNSEALANLTSFLQKHLV